ncbi:phosphonopyruvate decarboxylase [Flavobacteriaceae bacterium]|nr:phosphonopyruvate decarboxylase [Flavobacteriaceae bacterium]
MINVKDFYNSLKKVNIDFFTGVPDSLLKDICNYITDETPKKNNIIAANEGGAIGLAMGYNLASSKTPLVYMQNSGFGNTINPLLSLADPKVYSIPMLLLVGWRGEPGVKDEPQHLKQGQVSEELLKTMNIPYSVISNDSLDFKNIIKNATEIINNKQTPYVLLIRKGTFEPYVLKNKIITDYDLNREDAIKKIIDLISVEDIVVATTGKTSREVFEYRVEKSMGHEKDFLTVGGMGHANQIALGISIAKPERRVFCIDGDGAVLMHTGSMGIIGDVKPKNLKHIIINNGAHDSVGGQPTIGFEINFGKIANAFNYSEVFFIKSLNEFDEVFDSFCNSIGPSLLEIVVNKGARKDLGRPTISPKENKINFKSFIK